MNSAVYYPSINIRCPELIKTALLLWDKIECIKPNNDFRGYYPVELMPAREIVVKEIVPNKNQKELAHDLILDLATSAVPERYLISKDQQPSNRYEIYPNKFLSKTFDALEDTKLAERVGDRWSLEKSFGVTMMSILADVCAGSSKTTITDVDVAHTALLRSISGLHNGQDCDVNSRQDRLVNIAMDVIDPTKLDLDLLIDFRKREVGSSEGRHIKKLRRKFAQKIDELAAESMGLIGDGQSEKDIAAYFSEKLAEDLDDLKEALRMNRNSLLFSRPVIVSVAAAATFFVPAIGMKAAPVMAFSLASAVRNYRLGRRAAMESHAMAWLHTLTQPRFTDYAYRIGPIPAYG